MHLVIRGLSYGYNLANMVDRLLIQLTNIEAEIWPFQVTHQGYRLPEPKPDRLWTIGISNTGLGMFK